MLLRTEGDFIYATNIAYDLAGVVTTYLNLWRDHINGFNGVTIPKYEYAVTFKPAKKPGTIAVVIHWTDQRTYTETLYHDVDSDYFSEAWGSDNSYGSTSHTEPYPDSRSFNIPVSHLMMDQALMLKYFEDKSVEIATFKEELARQKRVDQLTKELAALTKGP